MEQIICISVCILTIFLLRLLFNINLKEAKKLENNNNLKKITNKFPENIKITEEMLEMLDNKNTKIEIQQKTKNSYYIAVTNKIIIADFKDNYARIQTIAHECLHSVQNKKLLMFNFIFSNFIIIYFVIAVILTICNVYKNSILQAFILLVLALIQFAIRGLLETDAMTKSKYLAKEYIESKNICTKEEIKELIIQYDKINRMGIPFYLYRIITSSLIKISIYLIVAAFC